MLQNQMIMETEVDNGRKLRVYDNLFDMQYRHSLYAFAQASKFQIGWADSSIAENQKYQFLHSVYSDDDLAKLQIVERLSNTPAAQEMVGHTLTKCILNLSTPADANFVHSHPEDKILLYYVNLEWRDGWHGETLFFDESGKNIMFASAYTPGRLIVFDAKIPHTIRPQSYLAAFYRMTLALVYTKC
jgi:hypothetical protein